MEQQKELDNPHMLESELGYLAAMIDGEGCITLERTGKRRLAGVMGLVPKVIVTNTNPAIVQHVVTLFQRLGVNPYIKTRQQADGWKTTCWVIVQGLSKCSKILRALKPYLVGKLAQAQLVLEFIERRGDPVLAKGKPYGEHELGILDRIRALNSRGVTETEDHGLRLAA